MPPPLSRHDVHVNRVKLQQVPHSHPQSLFQELCLPPPPGCPLWCRLGDLTDITLPVTVSCLFSQFDHIVQMFVAPVSGFHPWRCVGGGGYFTVQTSDLIWAQHADIGAPLQHRESPSSARGCVRA